MNSKPRILFFGSNDDSVTILDALYQSQCTIVGVVTQPPKPIGRKKIITPTSTENWAKTHKISCVHFPSNPEKPWMYLDEPSVVNTLSTFSADLLVSASYGLKIPTKTIEKTHHGGLNVHPSLLPRFRGADPIPWTILTGDSQAGVTIVTLTEKMDQGKIVAQQKIAIDTTATHIPLRHELFSLGAALLVHSLSPWVEGSIDGQTQKPEHVTQARRMKKIDGFVSWNFVKSAIDGKNNDEGFASLALHETLSPLLDTMPSPAEILDRMIRALSPWPGVYTTVQIKGEQKMLKLLSAHIIVKENSPVFILDQVQLEGKTPVSFEQFKKSYSIA